MKMRRKLLSVFLTLSFIISNFQIAHAIYKGKSALGNSFVVYLTINNRSACSGALVTNNIVVTAGHCMMPNNVLVQPNSIKVYRPGVNINQSSYETSAIAVKVPFDYDNSDDFTSPNDIAFILLEKPINVGNNLQIADLATTRAILASNNGIFVYGYGKTNSYSSTDIPLYYQANVIPQRRLSGFSGYESTYFSLSNDENGAACPGDSGGPVVGLRNGVQYLIGINSGGRGPCNDTGTGSFGATKTIVAQYLYLIDELNEEFENLRPSPVENLGIEADGYTGNISWDEPSTTPRKITGYLVVDVDDEILCETTNTSCVVEFKELGTNVFTVYSLAGDIRSEPSNIEFEVTNAEMPEFVGLDVYRETVLVKWESAINQGNADPDSILVRIKNGANGETLCESISSENGCSIDLSPNSFSLYMESESNLGKIGSTFVQRFSGFTYVNMISRVNVNYESIQSELFDLLQKNPGYTDILENFRLQLPDFESQEFTYSDDIWKQSLDLKMKFNQLKIRVITNPRLLTIKCIKGKLNKVVKARAPKCPIGYRQL
jgi:V8-like Glu-specific endopeptidase